MSAIYQMGKDIQRLEDRVYQLEDSNQCTCKDTPKPCGPDQVKVSVITEKGQLTDEAGVALSYITFTYSSHRIGDCEWLKESITVFSNGDYKDIYELKDHGKFFGDCFSTAHKIQNKAGHTFHEWKWRVKVAAGDKWNDTVTGHSEALKDAFHELNKVSSNFGCYWPC